MYTVTMTTIILEMQQDTNIIEQISMQWVLKEGGNYM